jgi:hypothetical protein
VLWAAYDRLIPHMRSICPAMVSSVTLVHSPALWLGLRREWSIVSGPGTYSTYTPSIQVSCFIQLWRSTRLTVMSAGRFTKLPPPPKAFAPVVYASAFKEPQLVATGWGVFSRSQKRRNNKKRP